MIAEDSSKGSDAVRDLADAEYNGDVMAALGHITDLYAQLAAEEAAGATVIVHHPDGSAENFAIL